MAIIIDTNCIANVFSKKSDNHENFEPVLNWILHGKGLMIYGGTKYKQELSKTSKYLPIIRLLKEVGKAVEGCKEDIDKYQKKIEDLRDNKDFDDPHLPAIAIVTRCKLVCSEDTRSIAYVQNGKYYPKGFSTPVYYTSIKNKNLLTDKYIDNSLKPLCKLNKSMSETVSKLLK
ncbi:hypothetical protein Oweho_0383 [Owenweeksia hongkongensis DSM 17368]|uniref:PIN domain-containing protein n=1 Tax=Owenweeksia hongkongensis (strain DSM 17368 / CIP 108786 / JCM 12287 / NRRL B-23963 / UST20020801) TaxID=926562 RepID=G8R8M1_OWEHD|nr:hypothetical protein [Owenweeksia hongkongensis]AEV31403.1 hypothetical protein Oweho_0383 [Owenweeksia hongkongensis DSM 17368]